MSNTPPEPGHSSEDRAAPARTPVPESGSPGNGSGHHGADRGERDNKDEQASDPAGAAKEERRHTEPEGSVPEVSDTSRLRSSRAERILKGSVSTTGGDATFGAHYGDKHTHNYFTIPAASGNKAGTPLPLPELTAVLAAYEPTPADSELRERLRVDRIAFLSGPEDSGRLTTGVTALADVTAPDEEHPLRLVRSATPFQELAEEVRNGDTGEASGYLLDVTDTAWVREATVTELTELRGALRDHGSHLVVLLGTGDEVGQLRERPIEHERVDAMAVFRRNLAWRLLAAETETPSREEVDRALAERVPPLLERLEKSQGAIVRSWMETLDSPAEAALLARLLASETRGGAAITDDLEARVGTVLYQRLLSRAYELLHSGSVAHPPIDQAYVIAGAVLDGCPLATVIEAAEDLTGRLWEAELPGGTWRRKTFARPLARRMRHVEFDQCGDGGGEAETRVETVVRLRQPPLWEAIVDVVWRDYEAARGPLRDWLVELCENHGDSPEVQVSAELALTRLAVHDFDLIVDEVLKPWSALRPAASRSRVGVEKGGLRWAGRLWHCRWTVARILESLVTRSPQRERALELLKRWLSARGGPTWHTALLALGTRIAREEPELVFRELRSALSRLGPPNPGKHTLGAFYGPSPWVAAVALEGYYSTGMRRHALTLITDRTLRERPAAALAAVHALLRICSLEKMDEEAEGVAAPDLLAWLGGAVDDPADHAPGLFTRASLTAEIAKLWAVALRHEHLSRYAWSRLHRWDAAARELDTVSGAHEPMKRLFEYLRSEPGLRERIEHYERIRDHLAAGRRGDGEAE